MKADCRRCLFFRTIDELLSVNPTLAEELLIKKEKGDDIKGWCVKRKRPIYYFEGYCRFFRPIIVKSKKLTEFFSLR